MAICGHEFNDSGWGWDTCTKKPGHKGDHYDKDSKSYASGPPPKCGFEFNDDGWGSDWCTKEAGHRGDHYDSASGHSCPNR